MEERKKIEQEFKKQLEKSVDLSNKLYAELSELQHYPNHDYCTLDQSRLMDLCTGMFVNTMSTLEKLNEIMIARINENRN